jgi:hypothetical protein
VRATVKLELEKQGEQWRATGSALELQLTAFK